MKLSKILILGVAAVAAAPMAQAKVEAPADSVSAAMATIIADYVGQSLEKQYPADDVATQQFIDGVKKAFSISSVETPYYDGIAQGMRMMDNLDQMRQAGFPLDNAMFIAAFERAVAGEATGFTPESADAYLSEVQTRAARADAAAQQAFLDSQLEREGVTRLPSGLIFEVVTEGEGSEPTAADTVEVFYTGRLADGTVFDKTGETPARMPVGRLIPGFTEGLKMMKPGGTYRLFIPASLGYGDRGAGSDIPGGAALDFTVTLVDVVKDQPANK